MMRFVSVALILVVVAMASASGTNNKLKPHYDVSNALDLFNKFINDFERQYKSEEDKEVHFLAFVKNLEKINKMNEENPSAIFGINKFADYTEEERQNMFGLRKSSH